MGQEAIDPSPGVQLFENPEELTFANNFLGQCREAPASVVSGA
jgi:hypothetical protein